MVLSREWTRCENESCKTTLKLAISAIHHFTLLKLEIRCLHSHSLEENGKQLTWKKKKKTDWHLLLIVIVNSLYIAK